MASTGTALWPGASTFPGAAVYPGQGNLPLLDVYISFSDVATSPPVWTWISPNKIRQFRVSRTEGETGTATLVLDNRTRAFDPTYVSSPYYPNVRPLNKVWLREQFAGRTNDMFVGYAESYDQQWPSGGWSDAIAVVTAADEFKVLSLMAVPTTSPPRNTYQELVAFDNPAAYYPLDAPAGDPGTQPTIDLNTVPKDPYIDTFALGELTDKAPSRKHVKKPVGRKKHGKRHFDKPIPIKRPPRG